MGGIPISVDYDHLYEAVLQQRLREIPQGQRDAAGSPNRRGQLNLDAPDGHAPHDAFTYLRGHAEVFRAVYERAGHVPPRKGERLLVVDIGAGAATVAVALADAVGKGTRRRIDYVAFEPHPMMRRLGERVLGHLDAQFRSARYIESLDDIDLAEVDRLLFTFSYVSHQDAVTGADVGQWASVIGHAVRRVGRAVELIYTTVSRDGGRLAELGRRLDDDGVSRKPERIRVRVKRRYPVRDFDSNRVQWDVQCANWQVRSEHWIMRR